MAFGTFLRRPVWRGIGLGLVCALAAWLVASTALFQGVEDWMLDACFSWRGTRHTDAKVVLIGLDAESIQELKKPAAYISPELAEVVRYAKAQGALAIGVDVIVPDDMSDQEAFTSERGLGYAAPMGKAVRDAGNVVLPEWHGEGAPLRPLWQWQLKALDSERGEPTDFGFVNLSDDGDQFVRRQQLLVGDDKPYALQFALALYARDKKADVEKDGDHNPVVAGLRVPLDGTMRINFVGPTGSFPVIPFRDVLADAKANKARPEMAGAIVIIGVTARTQQDYHSTPYANNYARWTGSAPSGLMSGPEIHAHTLATIHDRAFIHTPVWLSPLPLLLVVGVFLGIAYSLLSLRMGFLVAVGHHFAWKGLALGAFALFHWRIHLVAMLLLGTLAYGAAFVLRWRTLRKMFGLVKSEAVALALEADPHRLDPGGEEREVTVLFADIRSFTDFSEKHQPQEVVAMLNAYFDAVVPLIEAEGGTIDKYMGDGIMALFDAPASCPDHAARAARAAVAMVRRVHELKETWARLDPKEAWKAKGGMRIGVGVHTGRVVVGAIGSKGRLDWTAIGDTVNAAARIESENKPQETEVLISEATWLKLTGEETRKLGFEAEPRLVEVKGKTEKLRLYPVAVP